MKGAVKKLYVLREKIVATPQFSLAFFESIEFFYSPFVFIGQHLRVLNFVALRIIDWLFPIPV